MLIAVYPNDLIGSLYLVCQSRNYNPVQIPWWKLEFDEKRYGQIYGLVPAFLKKNSPLDIVPQTKV